MSPSFYIFNSAVITAFGKYEYTPATPGEARAWLLSHEWESCMGYEETAKALSELTTIGGKYPPIPIPMNRKTVQMKCKWNDEKECFEGDEALVFRVVFPSGYRPDPTKKGSFGEEFIRKNCELGVLGRME